MKSRLLMKHSKNFLKSFWIYHGMEIAREERLVYLAYCAMMLSNLGALIQNDRPQFDFYYHRFYFSFIQMDFEHW